MWKTSENCYFLSLLNVNCFYYYFVIIKLHFPLISIIKGLREKLNFILICFMPFDELMTLAYISSNNISL